MRGRIYAQVDSEFIQSLNTDDIPLGVLALSQLSILCCCFLLGRHRHLIPIQQFCDRELYYNNVLFYYDVINKTTLHLTASEFKLVIFQGWG